MLTYSSATLRRLKDSMSELHDHFWRGELQISPVSEPKTVKSHRNWLENGWVEGETGIEQLPDFARFHKIGAIDRHRRTDMKHMHRYSKAFLCIYSHFISIYLPGGCFWCTNVDRSIEPHVCKCQYSHVQAYIYMYYAAYVSLFVFVYSNVEVSCLRMCLRFSMRVVSCPSL